MRPCIYRHQNRRQKLAERSLIKFPASRILTKQTARRKAPKMKPLNLSKNLNEFLNNFIARIYFISSLSEYPFAVE